MAAQGATAAYMALAQPGLGPCWMLAEVRRFHPHPFSHPEQPHGHDYLMDLSFSSSSQPAPAILSPGDFLEGLGSLRDLWAGAIPPIAGSPLWSPLPSPPPPRLAAAV
jgi:hypothetical protein